MRQRLVRNMEGRYDWVNIEETPFKQKKVGPQGEDLTIDGYINKHGGIYSNADSRVHTTKSSYMDSLKDKGLTIKDW